MSSPAFVSTPVFGALEGFLDAACRLDQDKIPLPVFISATNRIIDEMAITVSTALAPAAPPGLLETLDTALRLVLDRALPPALACTGSLERVLERVLVRVLTPLVQSFLRLSVEWLAPLCSGGQQDTTIDRRPRVLAVLQSALQGLSMMREWLALEVLRQLEQIIHDNGGLTLNTAAERVQRVVVRETIWYLCSTLNIACCMAGGGNGLLKRAVEKKYASILGGQKSWAGLEGKLVD